MKLFNLTYVLKMDDYEEKSVIAVPGKDDRDARDKFLDTINRTPLFIHPSTHTFWPMFYTRAMITHSEEAKKIKPIPIDEATKLLKAYQPIETAEKKVRKPRGPNKKKAPVVKQGIKASAGRGRKKAS